MQSDKKLEKVNLNDMCIVFIYLYIVLVFY